MIVPLVRMLAGRVPADFDWAESQDEEDGPAAQLVDFWTQVVFARWQADRADWTGLPGDLLDTAHAGSHASPVATVLTARLAFYHSADPA